MVEFDNSDEIKKILQKDRKLCAKLYKAMFFTLKKQAKPYKVSKQVLSDLAQNAFEVFFKNLSNGKFENKSNPQTYLIGIAINMLFDYLKNQERWIPLDSMTQLDNLIQADFQPNFELENNVDKEAIKQKIYDNAYNKLDKDCKRLIQYNFKKIDKHEIAEKIGINNPEKVREWLYRCKMKLVKIMKDSTLYKKHLKE